MTDERKDNESENKTKPKVTFLIGAGAECDLFTLNNTTELTKDEKEKINLPSGEK